jgi:hypothetical protein
VLCPQTVALGGTRIATTTTDTIHQIHAMMNVTVSVSRSLSGVVVNGTSTGKLPATEEHT